MKLWRIIAIAILLSSLRCGGTVGEVNATIPDASDEGDYNSSYDAPEPQPYPGVTCPGTGQASFGPSTGCAREACPGPKVR